MRPSIATSARLRALVPALLLASLPLAAPASANLYWVGNNGSPPCTHATLQAAIDTAVGSPGFDLIYLVGAGPFNGPFTVLGGDLEIHGDVASCGSGVSVGQATLRATSGSRPLTILSGGVGTVRLRHLFVTTNNGSYNGDGGGIWFVGASPSSRLELFDTRVNANTAFGDGGGIFVSQGTLLLSTSTQVGLNAANRGGGVAAFGGAVVELHGASVLSNTALFDGGGIYAPDSRVLIDNLAASTTTSVTSNIAGGDGGGLYLGGDHDDTIGGLAAAPAAVNSNQAQRGAGLFIDGSRVHLTYGKVQFNAAWGDGGGVYLTGYGTLSSAVFGEPPTLGGLPLLERNSAGEGAAIYVADGGAVLTSGRIRDHQPGSAGAVTMAAVGEGLLLLHGVVVESNAAPALFGIDDSAELQLEHCTITTNAVGGIVRWRGASSRVNLVSTVLDETEPLFASFQTPATPPMLSCVLSHYGSPFSYLPPGTDLSATSIADPQLVKPPADVHLRYTSPAIDRCLAYAWFDSDGDARSYDDPYHANVFGTADAGADEASVMFIDGFESGNLTRWSGAAQ
jgi:predicted outer membrane repeat protein